MVPFIQESMWHVINVALPSWSYVFAIDHKLQLVLLSYPNALIFSLGGLEVVPSLRRYHNGDVFLASSQCSKSLNFS